MLPCSPSELSPSLGFLLAGSSFYGLLWLLLLGLLLLGLLPLGFLPLGLLHWDCSIKVLQKHGLDLQCTIFSPANLFPPSGLGPSVEASTF